jgi:hypothetical protein
MDLVWLILVGLLGLVAVFALLMIVVALATWARSQWN